MPIQAGHPPELPTAPTGHPTADHSRKTDHSPKTKWHTRYGNLTHQRVSFSHRVTNGFRKLCLTRPVSASTQCLDITRHYRFPPPRATRPTHGPCQRLLRSGAPHARRPSSPSFTTHGTTPKRSRSSWTTSGTMSMKTTRHYRCPPHQQPSQHMVCVRHLCVQVYQTQGVRARRASRRMARCRRGAEAGHAGSGARRRGGQATRAAR